LFGQYAEDRPAGLDLIGSFDGWAAASDLGGERFDMFWRNEAHAGIVIESGTASTTISGDVLTGTWSGTSNGMAMTGTFEADPARCRLTTLPGCTGGCMAGKTCVKDVCIGQGVLRFTMEWDASTDLDLYVRTPAGEVISWRNTVAGTGSLDVDDQGGGRLVENIFFAAPAPTGMYEFWVDNYDGTTAANYTIRVATPSTTVATYSGALAAAPGESQHYVYVR
jgi:hypothetical protein